MLTHPHTLELLCQWKLSPDQEIPKDLLVLIIYNNNKIQISELLEILFKYKKKKQKKEINLEIIKNSLETYFYYENGCYNLKDKENLSKSTLKLIINPFSHPKIDYLKNLYENIDNLEIFTPDLACKTIYKLMEHIKDTEINLKKFVGNVENLIKTLDPKFVPKRLFVPKDSLTDSSMLNFITKREKVITQNSKFDPIHLENSIYEYNLKNPNYTTLRKRKDLINPVKKIFIKFGDESRPPKYKIQPYQVFNRNSLKKLLNVDYEEDSTWADEDGEDINSEDSEEISEEANEEFVEEDSIEQNTTNIKRPMLIFPKVKCIKNDDFIKNEEFSDFWSRLPLEKVKNVNEELRNILNYYKDKEYCVQKLSNIFMIQEDILKEHLIQEK